MSDRVVFTASGLDALEKALTASPQAVNKAERRALRRTIKWVRRQMLREASQRFEVPQSRFVKAKRASTIVKDSGGRAWLGIAPIRAGLIGKPRHSVRSGVRVGRHKFPHSFVATMENGYTGIFERRGKSRLPIDENVVEGNVSSSFMRWLSNVADERLIKEFVDNLEFYSGARG